MKWIVGFLILVNLAIFLMIQQEPLPTPDRRGVQERPDIGDLKLLSEVDALDVESNLPGAPDPASGNGVDGKERLDEADTAGVDTGSDSEEDVLEKRDSPATNEEKSAGAAEAQAPAIVPQDVCGSLGPLGVEDEARKLSARLEAAGLEVSLNTQFQRIPYRYRVVVPPLENRKEASEMLERMKKAGLKDLQRFSHGEFRNGISLGTFSTPENAATRREAVAKRGFEAEIAVDYEQIPEYWIDYRYGDPELARPVEALLRENANLISRDLACPHIVSG